MAILEFEEFGVEFGSGENWVPAITQLNMRLDEGEGLCLIGESGSGKTVTAMSVARLLDERRTRYSGELRVEGENVLGLGSKALAAMRGRAVGYVFQSPSTSLNPLMTVEAQIQECLVVREGQRGSREKVKALLEQVGIPDPSRRAKAYAHQLSGGMQQRVMIAMAIALRPKLLIADEPTTALDVTIERQVLDLLCDLRQRYGMAILMVTHNLGVVKGRFDRLAVMYAGQIVESGDTEKVLARPSHPYTAALLQCVPSLNGDKGKVQSIPGRMARMGEWGRGCRFSERCSFVRSECRRNDLVLEGATHGGSSRCPVFKDGGLR